MHWGMSCRQYPRIGTPRVGVPRLPSMVPPRAVTAYAYLSWSVLTIKLDHLPRKLRDEPFMRGTIGVPVGIQLTL
jgi:hypothetical protein